MDHSALSSKLLSRTSIFKSCEIAFNLIRDGKDNQAKQQYPLEYYLVKKYLYRSLDAFKAQLADRLELQ